MKIPETGLEQACSVFAKVMDLSKLYWLRKTQLQHKNYLFSLLTRFREYKIYGRKLKRAIAKRDYTHAKYIENNLKPEEITKRWCRLMYCLANFYWTPERG